MSFEPETVDSYEVGYRASLFDRRLNVALALFHADYNDVQVPGSIGTVINGQLDVLAHAATADPALTRALFEARRLLLREAARLAAQRRDDAHAVALDELAAAFADAEQDEAAQAIDLAFMGVLIEAAGNLVFTLILNSIRELYLQHLGRFRPIVARRDALGPLYAEAAAAVAAADAERAAAAVERLAGLQEEAMTG
jgi:DNA-binding FadR family transcriptional regulator